MPEPKTPRMRIARVRGTALAAIAAAVLALPVAVVTLESELVDVEQPPSGGASLSASVPRVTPLPPEEVARNRASVERLTQLSTPEAARGQP